MPIATLSRGVSINQSSSISGRSHIHAKSVRPVISCVRPSRRSTNTASAAYRSASWNDGSSDPMLNMINDVAKAWKASQVDYNTNRARCNRARCNPCDSTSTAGSGSQHSPRKPSLPVDLLKTESAYQLFLDIPGLSKPDLKIKVSNSKAKDQGANPRALTISGERQAPLQEGYLQKQRKFGGFENVWQLPAEADTEGISAKVTDGVLTVTVPRKQQQDVDDSQEIFIS